MKNASVLTDFKVRHILFACVLMCAPTWNPLNNVRSLMLLLKRHAVISAVRLGDSILFWLVSRRTGCSCQQFLLEEMRYIPALYTVTVSKWGVVTWIPDNCFGYCHLLSVTFKSITTYAKAKRLPWWQCIPKFKKQEKNLHGFAFTIFPVSFCFVFILFLLDKINDSH